jgi:hypothetical protein
MLYTSKYVALHYNALRFIRSFFQHLLQVPNVAFKILAKNDVMWCHTVTLGLISFVYSVELGSFSSTTKINQIYKISFQVTVMRIPRYLSLSTLSSSVSFEFILCLSSHSALTDLFAYSIAPFAYYCIACHHDIALANLISEFIAYISRFQWSVCFVIAEPINFIICSAYAYVACMYWDLKKNSKLFS